MKTLGIVREGYSKWERRSPLTPSHVARAIQEHNFRVIVQPSTLRVFTNDEYARAGAEISENLEPCDCIVGVKQVEASSVLPKKTYVFFSHTIKAQESNMKLLDTILERNVRLIDHECIRDVQSGERLVAFGDYAGRAGMLESLRGIGLRLLGLGYSTPFLNIGPTYSYKSLDDAMNAASQACEDFSKGGGAKSFLPPGFGPMCFVFTGSGKVSRGAQDVFRSLPYSEMLEDVNHFQSDLKDPTKIYGVTVRDVDVMRKKSNPDGDVSPIDRKDYLTNPHLYTADRFAKHFLPHANLVLTGAYWDARYPKWMPNTPLVTSNSKKLLMVADVSCDVNGTFEGLSRSTSIEDPYYCVDFSDQMREVTKEQLKTSTTKKETNPALKLVLGVDILPSELPREASKHFGDCLYPFLPQLCQGDDCGEVLERATIAKHGSLTPQYAYIGKMRAERERSKRIAASIREDESKRTRLIKLQGHLFDTKLINRVLDLIENKQGKFQIMQASLAQPRGGHGRELRAHTVVLLNLVGGAVKIEDDSSLSTEDLIVAIERLVKESPGEAEATVSILSESEAKSTLADLQQSDQSRKEVASFSHEAPMPSTISRARSTGTSAAIGGGGEEGEVLVLGSGMVSAPAIDYLAKTNPGKMIHVVGGDANEVESLKKRFAKRNVLFDLAKINDASSVKPFIHSQQQQQQDQQHFATTTTTRGVLSLLPAPMHLEIAEACLDAKVPLATASYVGKMKETYDQQAKQLNVPILCEMGLDPGMDHMSCMKMIAENGGGEEVVCFESYCGGLPAPESGNNPLGYKLTWSPRGVLTALKNPAKFLSNGEIKVEENILRASKPFILSGYAYPAMNLEAMPNRDATIYAEPYHIDLYKVKTFFRGTLRFRGFCEVLSDFESAGWLDDILNSAHPFNGKTWGDVLHISNFTSERTRAFLAPYASMKVDCSTTKLDALCELFKVALKMDPEDRDLVLMEHRFEFRNGSKATSNLIVFGDKQDSAMAKTVGVTAGIGTQLLMEGKHPGGGVHLPTESWVYIEALKRLEREGLSFTESKSAKQQQ